MFHIDDIWFVVAFAIGCCLVLGSGIGLSDLGAPDLDAGPEDGGDAESDATLTSVLGLGRVPLLILAMLASLLFGATGLSVSAWLHALLGDVLGALSSVALALVLSLLGTRLLSRWLARVLPSSESYASCKSDLVGARGTVVVSSRHGETVLRVIDAGGAELRVRCDTRDRELKCGESMHLVAYDATRDRFEVERVSAS